jgi:hypothetical protein
LIETVAWSVGMLSVLFCISQPVYGEARSGHIPFI